MQSADPLEIAGKDRGKGRYRANVGGLGKKKDNGEQNAGQGSCLLPSDISQLFEHEFAPNLLQPSQIC